MLQVLFSYSLSYIYLTKFIVWDRGECYHSGLQDFSLYLAQASQCTIIVCNSDLVCEKRFDYVFAYTLIFRHRNSFVWKFVLKWFLAETFPSHKALVSITPLPGFWWPLFYTYAPQITPHI